MSGGKIRVGIGGWTYDPWRETFYPPEVPKARELEYAASKLTAIEVNGTYYSGFKPDTFRKWAAATPEGFVFTLKASRFCTNRKVLADGADSVERFLTQGIDQLGSKLGAILWQFMATKKFDPEDFAGFLKLLPEKIGDQPLRHALEVRHESFEDPKFIEMSREANAAIVFADKEDAPSIDVATSDFRYARLQRSEADVGTGYCDAALDDWAKQAKIWAKRGDAFVFFISGAKERNPAAAMALIERL